MDSTDKRTELLATLGNEVEKLTSTEGWRAWLKAASRFHAYSLNNQLLIACQRPDATRVAGYQAWRKLGRQVRRGERGIRILAPMVRRVCADETDTQDSEGARRVITGFRVVSVFDLGQTDGDPLPESPTELLHGEGPEGVLDALEAVAGAEGISIHRQEISSGANGYLNREGRQILISSTLDPAAQIKTLAHELGHLFDPWLVAKPEGYSAHRGLCEVVAEAVAYIVGDAFGLNTSAYSVGYVASWAEGDASKVQEVAGRVNTAADAILSHPSLVGASEEVLPDAA